MPGRCVQRLWLKPCTGESHVDATLQTGSPPTDAFSSVVSFFSSDDHVKFFCFQVLEHQIKFR